MFALFLCMLAFFVDGVDFDDSALLEAGVETCVFICAYMCLLG